MSIEATNVEKKFGAYQALHKINLKVNSGELVALLGPSGSGKTTLLRIIAGLETQDAGDVAFYGEDISQTSVKDRKVGFVFQHYALFKHMTVFDNIAFGLRVKKNEERRTEREIHDKVNELLKLVRLDGLASRYPTQLSGGQRQRVALARALAIEPKVLLLDEPFGSLDANVRKELRQWLRRLHDRLHMTTLFVTHDQEEALELADKIVILNNGKIEQEGTPEEVYHRPANPFVYHFLGNVNLFHCRIEEGAAFLGEKKLELQGNLKGTEKTAKVYVRPHLLDLQRKSGPNVLAKGIVEYINGAGALVKVYVKTSEGETLYAEISHERNRELQLQKGEEVYLESKQLTFFSGDYSI